MRHTASRARTVLRLLPILLALATAWLVAPAALASTVVLQVPLTLETSDGKLTTLDPGIYTVARSGPEQLDIVSESTTERWVVSAKAGSHEESLDAPLALVVPEPSGPLHIVLMLPNGEQLEAIAGPSGVTTRGTTSLSKTSLTRYVAVQKTVAPTSCPRCPVCQRCTACPPPVKCPRCPTCPVPTTCPEQPLCPDCPPPPVCPQPEPCPDATCPGDEVAQEPAGPVLIAPAVQQQLVDMHNAVRAAVNPPNGPIPPLVWDDEVAAVAQAYVDTCPGLAHNTNRYLPSAGSGFGALMGENLAASSGLDVIQTGMNGWSSEQQYFDHGSRTCQPGAICGHYTQLIWRNSAKVGCGIRTDCDGQGAGGWPNIIVCNYYPPGNYGGQPPY